MKPGTASAKALPLTTAAAGKHATMDERVKCLQMTCLVAKRSPHLRNTHFSDESTIR